jgi:hypothetical protein
VGFRSDYWCARAAALLLSGAHPFYYPSPPVKPCCYLSPACQALADQRASLLESALSREEALAARMAPKEGLSTELAAALADSRAGEDPVYTTCTSV